MGAAQVRDALEVAPLRLGGADLGRQRAREVGEQQVLAGHWQAQQPIQETPAPPLHESDGLSTDPCMVSPRRGCPSIYLVCLHLKGQIPGISGTAWRKQHSLWKLVVSGSMLALLSSCVHP